mmetsp:Transcript_91842/g.230789  ORF Transcript_91842/g.230789 Transcript_91842/m.230789 type:complete len:212 (+) Transcript_91842:1145-1780(+)
MASATAAISSARILLRFSHSWSPATQRSCKSTRKAWSAERLALASLKSFLAVHKSSFVSANSPLLLFTELVCSAISDSFSPFNMAKLLAFLVSSCWISGRSASKASFICLSTPKTCPDWGAYDRKKGALPAEAPPRCRSNACGTARRPSRASLGRSGSRMSALASMSDSRASLYGEARSHPSKLKCLCTTCRSAGCSVRNSVLPPSWSIAG